MSVKSNSKSMRWIIAAVLAVVLCVCLCFGAACSKTNDGAVGKRTYFNKVDPVGATPEVGYDGNDYVNYIAYVLEQQDEWYAVSDSQAKASVNNQQIWTDKYYKNGYMLTTQKSYSTFSKEAFEALFVTGRQGSSDKERGVYLRTGSDPKNKDHDLGDINWGKTESDITYYLEEDYYYMHGLFSDEISVFMINDETIEKADPVVLNDDGTYSQRFVLDTDDSVWYYQYSMKNHGSLPTYPAFSKVEVTITFDEGFRILSLYSEEQSTVKRAGSNWQNKTSATTTYTYSDMTTAEADIMNGKGWDTIWSEAGEVLSEAEEYFGTWYGKVEPTEATTKEYSPDASDALMGALSGMLSAEGDTYEMEISYDGMGASGYLFAAIDLESWDSLTFDFSDFGIMDWVTFALEAYEYAHIIVAVEDDAGNQELLVDLLPGSSLLDILGGKLVNVYFGDGLFADSETVAAYADNLMYTAFMSVGEALDAGIKTYAGDSDDDGMVMTLDYDNEKGKQPARVYLGMSGFEMHVDCYIDKETTGKKKNKTTTYEYELSSVVISVSSIGLDITLTPDMGDKKAHVTPAEGINDFALDTLVVDLITSVLDLSSSSYINESYTFSGNLSLDISMSLDGIDFGSLDSIIKAILGDTLDLTVALDNLVFTLGDVTGDFYISLVGDLQACSIAGMIDVTTASTIGFTWCGDYIVMVKDLETETPTYRMMTTECFGKYALDSDADISPIAWLLGTGSVAWGIVAGMFDGSDSGDASGTSLIETLASENQSLLDWLNLGQYVSGIGVVLGGETKAQVGDFDVEETFGLTDDYWAFELGDDFISNVTSGIVDSAAIAITQNMNQLGGIYLVGSVYSLLDLTLNLNYETNLDSTYDLFGGNLVLAVTEEQTVVDEEGNETTEMIVVGINAQLVPNLYKVYMEILTGWGMNESDLTFKDAELKISITYDTGNIFSHDYHTVETTTTGSFVCYEYTVGSDSYSAIYKYEVSGVDTNNNNYEYSDSGTYQVDVKLENYPTDEPDPEE